MNGLNPQQREAVLAVDGPVLILAGAGSGKTRTLVHRIAHLISTGIEPKRIAAVTFTNRAAGEMRERVARESGTSARGLTLCTFHSLGARILRSHAEAAGLPESFSIYAAGDQLGLVRRVMAEEVRVTATAGEDRYDAKRVLSTISAWKNRMVTPPEAVREVREGRLRENRDDDYAVLAADVYPRYEDALRAAGACDFDDLLLLPVRLLTENTEVREQMWRRWHYLMVDEYQDTNGVQLEMARLLAGPRKNLCVVGDDDQSIYAWRGADLRNILDFENHFPGARVILLETNYRSTRRVIDAAAGLIAHNPGRREKRMRAESGLGPPIDYWEIEESAGRGAEEMEAQMVASEIGIRRFRESLPWGEFGVLYRANHQARVLEEAMREANIPYRVVGGTSFFDRKEISDAIAYLRVLANPRDELSLRRIINYPTRGIGRTTQMKLIEVARAAGVPLQAVLRDPGALEDLGTAQAEAVLGFGRVLSDARAELEEVERSIADGDPKASLQEWASGLLREVGLEEAIRSENPSDRAADARVDNLRDFLAAIGAYERRRWAEQPLPDEEADWAPPTLRGFLEQVSLIAEEETEDDGSHEPGGQVTLMTLHSAKGLEFAHVFIVGLEEELLPHARTVAEIGQETGALDPIAEERRLLYVGMTRARHRLTLSRCITRRRGSETIPRQPSRFLKEIPQELLSIHSASGESSLNEEDRAELKADFFSKMREMLK